MKEMDQNLLSKCIREQNDGILINIEVKSNAKTQGIEGMDEWRGSLIIRVKARAEKGKANYELISLLSSVLSISPSNINIEKGNKSRQKIVKVMGLSKDELEKKLMSIIQ
ncbi:MAG: YggU family protein [Thermoplasmata archaeon]|nr:MAG: YggU family protein [Thermoplasmata archaeon]